MDKRLILLALSILLLLPLLNVTLFSLVNMVTPSVAGFDILYLARIGGYIIVPLIYAAAFAFAIFRYNLSCDSRTIAAIVVIGLILLPAVFIVLKGVLVPSLSPTSIGGVAGGVIGTGATDVSAEYSKLFLNKIIIGGYYLGFCLSLFLTSYSEDRKLKTLIFLLGGLALGFVFSLVYTYIYAVLA